VADTPRVSARRITLFVALPAAFVLAWTLAALPVARTTGDDTGDVALWAEIVARMTAGETYYAASSTELRARHYPTRSVFNWRQPLVYEFTAIAGIGLARLALIAIAIYLLAQTGRVLRWNVVGLLAILNTTLMLAAPYGPYLTELWAGAFLALSVLAYAACNHRGGAAWGLLALFVRELAAPYCVIAAAIAVWRRRWSEVAFWGIGGAAYAGHYAWHASQVWQQATPGDVAHAHSWLYWGGLRYLLETWHYNGLLLIAPAPVFALWVAGVTAAAWAPRMPLHLRAAVIAYTLIFLAIGQPFNGYWGFLTAPLMSLWLAYAPAALATRPAAVTETQTPRSPGLAPPESPSPAARRPPA
jgi:hypothetical protein